MSVITSAIRAVERTELPDTITRLGIKFLVGQTRRRLSMLSADDERKFAAEMKEKPIADFTDLANEQHYELPADFFRLALGPRRKYSCCFYDDSVETLEQAETFALQETVTHAGLTDGQSILELGCGWGSLTLFMAMLYPNAKITAVSNSTPQRHCIEAVAKARGITNVTIITADMNSFEPDGKFDRIVSVEMFEHMANWTGLLNNLRTWLTPEGRLFIHVFTHKNQPYHFDHSDKANWIAQHFFTGGIMPSEKLIYQFPNCFTVENEWRWSGTHYERTANDWLKNFDANLPEINRILTEVYGPDAAIWRRRWRLFFLATAGLFGHKGGHEWGVNHYLLRPNHLPVRA